MNGALYLKRVESYLPIANNSNNTYFKYFSKLIFGLSTYRFITNSFIKINSEYNLNKLLKRDDSYNSFDNFEYLNIPMININDLL